MRTGDSIDVEEFNNGGAMVTVKFSVPEDVKRAFDETFRGRNRSAILAELMRRAVDEELRVERRRHAMDALLARRDERRGASAAEVRRAHEEGGGRRCAGDGG